MCVFLAELYQGAAEPLPECAIDSDWLETDMAADWASTLDPDVSSRGPMGLANLLLDVKGLPVRFLPPGRPRDLYWQYLCWCDNVKSRIGGWSLAAGGMSPADNDFRPASWATFWRTWSEEWQSVLKFRQRSQHTRCNRCHELEERMRASRGNASEKLAIAKLMRGHLREQFVDRSIYQATRWLSRNSPGDGVMTLIIDGMDKTKFRLPRYKMHKLPKFLDKHYRPHLTCMACICHGWTTGIFLADENVDTGGNMMCEIVLRMVSRVLQMCRESGRQFPKHIVIVTDNTVALAKNAVTFNLLAWLTSRGLASSLNLWNLREGHTHEDIGSDPHLHLKECHVFGALPRMGDRCARAADTANPRSALRGDCRNIVPRGRLRGHGRSLQDLSRKPCVNCLQDLSLQDLFAGCLHC